MGDRWAGRGWDLGKISGKFGAAAGCRLCRGRRPETWWLTRRWMMRGMSSRARRVAMRIVLRSSSQAIRWSRNTARGTFANPDAERGAAQRLPWWFCKLKNEGVFFQTVPSNGRRGRNSGWSAYNPAYPAMEWGKEDFGLGLSPVYQVTKNVWEIAALLACAPKGKKNRAINHLIFFENGVMFET